MVRHPSSSFNESIRSNKTILLKRVKVKLLKLKDQFLTKNKDIKELKFYFNLLFI